MDELIRLAQNKTSATGTTASSPKSGNSGSAFERLAELANTKPQNTDTTPVKRTTPVVRNTPVKQITLDEYIKSIADLAQSNPNLPNSRTHGGSGGSFKSVDDYNNERKSANKDYRNAKKEYMDALTMPPEEIDSSAVADKKKALDAAEIAKEKAQNAYDSARSSAKQAKKEEKSARKDYERAILALADEYEPGDYNQSDIKDKKAVLDEKSRELEKLGGTPGANWAYGAMQTAIGGAGNALGWLAAVPKAVTDKALELAGVKPDTDSKETNGLQDFGQYLIESGSKNIEGAKYGESGAKQVLIDLGVQSIQMAGDAAANIVTPGAGLAALGVRSFGSSAYEAQQQGAGFWKQGLYGAVNATAEVLTEKMFDTFAGKVYGEGMADALVNNIVGRIANTPAGQTAWRMLINGFGEGAEEVASDIVNGFADVILLKKEWKEAFDPAQIAYDFFIGSLMGFLGEGGQVITGQSAYSNDVSRFFAEQKAEGKTFKQAMQEYKDAYAVEPFARTFGDQADAVRSAYKAGTGKQDITAFESAYEAMYKAGAERVNYQTAAQSEDVNALNDEQKKLAYQAGAKSAGKGSSRVTVSHNGKRVTREQTDTEVIRQAVDKLDAPLQVAEILVQGYETADTPADVYAQGILEAYRFGQMGVSIEQAIANSDFADKLTEPQYRHAFRLGQQAAPNQIIRTQEQKTVDSILKTGRIADSSAEKILASDEYRTAFEYLTGEKLTGTEAEQISAIKEAAAAYAQNNTETSEGKASRASGKVSFSGGVVDGKRYKAVNMSGLTRGQKAAIDSVKTLAKLFNVNFVFYESDTVRLQNGERIYTGANGIYKDNTIYLDINGGKNTTADRAAILRVAAHELTHYIQDNSPESYESLKAFVKEKLTGNEEMLGMSWDELIKGKIKRSGNTLSESEAIDEVVADACEMMLKNSKAAEMAASADPELAGKIRDFMRNFAAKVKAAFKGVDAYHAEARVMEQYAEELQKIWDDALVKATGNENAVEQGKAQYQARDAFENVIVDKDVSTEEVKATLQDIYENPKQNLDFTFPILKEAPFVYEYATKIPGKRSFVMHASKAAQAMLNRNTDDHNLGVEGLMQVISKLDDPDYIIYQNKGRNAGHYVALVMFGNGEAVAAVDIGNYRSGKNATIDSENGYYDVLITAYNELDEKASREFDSFEDYIVDLIGGDTNDVVYDKEKDGESMHVALGERLSGRADSSSTDSVPQIASKSQGQFSLRDSEGRTLSPGQQEYFKDSKVRDEDGNLLVVYHGTDADFTVFDRTKVRAGNIQGMFFSPWELDAAGYGGKVGAYYLNITNPASEAVGYKALNRFKGQNNAGVKAREYLERLGYDGVNNGGEEYIAFNANQIKAVDNINPTEDPDIRYSERDLTESRKMLADAMESAAQNDTERGIIEDYRRSISQIAKVQGELQTVREELSQARADGAKRDTIIKLENRAEILAKQVDRADGKLIKLEAAAPIKRMITRARADVRRAETVKRKESVQKAVEREREQKKKELDRVRESRDKRLQAQKEKAQAQMQNYRERRNESADVKKYRAQIEKLAKDLSDMLLTNNDKRHVPEQLKGIVADFLSSIDFTSRGMQGPNMPGVGKKKDISFAAELSRLRDVLNGNNKNIQFDVYDSLPENIIIQLNVLTQEIIENTAVNGGEYTIAQMNSEQLRVLRDSLKALGTAIRNMNMIYSNGRWISAAERAKGTIAAAEKMPAVTKKAGGFGNFISYNNTTPYYFFKRLGSDAAAVFKDITDGWGKLAVNAKEIIDFVKSVYTGKQAKEWRKEMHTITFADGRTAQISSTQLMSLYMLLNREQAVGHLNAGGIRIGTLDKLNQASHYKWNSEDAAKYVEHELTNEQKEIAKKLQAFMESVGGRWGNEISMLRWGIEQFGEKNYFPIQTDNNDRSNSNTAAKENDLYRLINFSATKALTPNATNALVLNDIFDVFADHMADMAKYNSLAMPILNATKWFNYREGNDSGVNLKTALENAYGKGAGEYFNTFMKDLNGVHEGGRGESFLRKMMGNAKAAAVGTNIRVVLQQFTSYIRAGLLINPKYLAQGVFSKNSYDEMMKSSGLAVWKIDLNFFDVNIGRSLREQIKNAQSVFDRISDVSMAPAAWADRVTWVALWNACKAETQAKTGISGDELLRATKDRFEEVIMATQVMDSTINRSQLMRGSSGLVQEYTAFMSEPTLTYNTLLDAYSQFLDESKRTGRKSAMQKYGKTMIKTIGLFALSSIAVSAAAAISDAGRDDDDYETWLQKWSDATVENFKDNINPLGLLPYFNTLKSLLNGYSNDSLITSGIDQLLTSGLSAAKKLAKGQELSWKDAYKLIQGVSTLTGLPVTNALRSSQEMVNSVITIWNDIFGRTLNKPVKHWHMTDISAKNMIKSVYTQGNITEDEASELLISEGVAGNKNEAYFIINEWAGNKKYDALKDALLAGDNNAITAARNDLTEHGVKKADINKQITSIVGDAFTGGTIDKTTAYRLLTVYGKKGAEEAKKKLLNWQCLIDTGVSFNNLEDAYLAGDISAKEAVTYLKKYGGESVDSARITVDWWAFSENENDFGWNKESYEKYVAKYKPLGLSPKQADDYTKAMEKCKGTDANGDGHADTNTVRDEKIAAIIAMPYSDAMKLKLFMTEYDSDSAIEAFKKALGK